VGIGVPSKYFDFPVASLGNACTVTLKRARRVRPQRTKKVRKRWSTGVRRPIAKAAAAGETPNETCGAGWLVLALAMGLVGVRARKEDIPNQQVSPTPGPSDCSSFSISRPCHP
jgi:anti-sigma factor RsiW